MSWIRSRRGVNAVVVMTSVAVVVAAIAGLFGMGPFDTGNVAAADNRPNILLIVSDDQRPDTIAAFGNAIIRTPILDSLVRRGTTFSRATCAYPLCVPSRAELLTGVVSFRNGVHPPRNKANLDRPTLPSVLAEAGYETWHVGKWMIAGLPWTRGFTDTLGYFASSKRPQEPQYDYRGRQVTGYLGWEFQTRWQLRKPEGRGLTPDISEAFADAAIEFVERKSGKPFFLQVDFTAPHDPLLLPTGYEEAYDPEEIPLPGNFAAEHPFDHGNLNGRDELISPAPRSAESVQRDIAAYYAIIEHMDSQIGRILNALEKSGQSKNTIVIFSSDHGLALGSHGLMGKQNMYEHTINVPLIFAGPEIPAGETKQTQCYLRDLVPTIYELAGVERQLSLDAKSLLPVIRGESHELYPFIIGYYADAQRMIRDERYKYVWYPAANREQLFDLAADPLELNSLDPTVLAQDPALAETKARLREHLIEWLKQHEDPLVSSDSTTK